MVARGSHLTDIEVHGQSLIPPTSEPDVHLVPVVDKALLRRSASSCMLWSGCVARLPDLASPEHHPACTRQDGHSTKQAEVTSCAGRRGCRTLAAQPLLQRSLRRQRTSSSGGWPVLRPVPPSAPRTAPPCGDQTSFGFWRCTAPALSPGGRSVLVCLLLA